MLHILSKPYKDEFVMDLILPIAEKNPSVTIFYLWSIYSRRDASTIIEYINTHNESTYILAIKDNLTLENISHDYIGIFTDLVNQFSDKNFIIFTSLENLKSTFASYLLPRTGTVEIIEMGGCITNQVNEYKTIEPNLVKNFNSDKVFVCLGRNPRLYRLANLLLLKSHSLDQFGLISFLSKNKIPHSDFLDFCPWEFKSEHTEIRSRLLTEFDKFKSSAAEDFIINTTYEQVWPHGYTDDYTNFTNSLRDEVYNNVFVEIITETIFENPFFNITEKTKHSVLGRTFPIWLSAAGTVGFMRTMGLDVFDDIIDHSYDLITDDIVRLNEVTQRNKQILSNPKLAKELWLKNIPRFEKNIEFIKSVPYDFYKTRFIKKCQLAGLVV